MFDLVRQMLDVLRRYKRIPDQIEGQMILQGRLLAEMLRKREAVESLREVEFRVFSQFGDDGIIQWLVFQLDIPYSTFIEFGVGDYYESNTRFLLMNNNWSGYVMDGSARNIQRIRRSSYFWKHSLGVRSVFIDRENINGLLAESGFDPEVGILHIDLDGVDYWVWEAINNLSPILVILEYNSVFGDERAVTIPYDAGFARGTAHYSHLYWGASLPALQHLSARKGYAFVGCNGAGNNAYFVRTDKLNSVVKEKTVKEGFVDSVYREGRTRNGDLSFVAGDYRIALVRGLPVYNIFSGEIEPL